MSAVLTARRAALVGLAVVGLVVTGCEPSILRQINPCGTIFTAQTTDEDGETTAGFCDPLGWDLLFLDIPDFSADPTCSIPGFCGDGFVPTDETAKEHQEETEQPEQDQNHRRLHRKRNEIHERPLSFARNPASVTAQPCRPSRYRPWSRTFCIVTKAARALSPHRARLFTRPRAPPDTTAKGS